MKKSGYMKKIIAAAMAAATIVTTLSTSAFAAETETVPTNSREVVKEMGLGFNLGFTFAQVNPARQNWDEIKQRIDSAYEAGFNTIRLMVRWQDHLNEDGTVREDEITDLLQQTVRYCEDKDLYVIVGCSDVGEGNEGRASRWDLSEACDDDFRKEYANMWTDIANMFSDCDYHVVFEPYNEPVQQQTDYLKNNKYGYKTAQGADAWYFAGRCGNLKYIMQLNKDFAAIMKKNCPDRFYMVGSYNADPRAAFEDYTNKTWEDSNDHYINGSWNNTYWLAKGVDTKHAIYFCHAYKYGKDFDNYIGNVKTAFKNRGIDLPIYVDENGTHTSNFKGADVNGIFVEPVRYMTQDLDSGICLWDDTQSMSFLNIKDMTWFNENLINAMVDAAGQTPRLIDTVEDDIETSSENTLTGDLVFVD